MSKQFQKGYILKSSGFNFRSLHYFCDELVFLETGGKGEHVDTTREALYRLFADFDPSQDIVVPIGSALVNLLAGQVLGSMGTFSQYNIAVFLDRRYQFWRVSLSPKEDSFQL